MVSWSVKEQYEKFPYPNPKWYDFDTHKYVIDGVQELSSRILVIGCGTTEAFVIARSNTNSQIVGVDFSSSSVKFQEELKRKYNVPNMEIYQEDIFDHKGEYDVMVCSGVMHHIPDVDGFLEHIKTLGPFLRGMVYSYKDREFIRGFVDYFRENDFSVDDVRDFFTWDPDAKNHKNYTQAKSWYLMHTKDDEEIADTWLHPHFVEYTEETLTDLLSKHGWKVYNMSCGFGKLSFLAGLI